MYLNTHTYYSLRYGTISPEGLLELAQENGVSQFAITDINNASACLEIIRRAPKFEIKPIVGIDFRNGIEQLYLAIAKNNKGFQEINTYLTPFLVNKSEVENGVKEIPKEAPDFKEVVVVYPYKKGKEYNLKKHEFIGVSPKDLDYIRIKKIDVSKAVILQTVSFRSKKDFNAHRLLRAIDKNQLLSKLPLTEQANPEDKMLPEKDLLMLYEGYPKIIENTARIFKECTIDFDLSDTALPQNQKHYTNSAEEDYELLLKLCKEGINYRYPKQTQQVKDRIKKELDTIQQMGFVSYFLMNWDIVTYARSKGYFYVGRGSGANSVIAYLLRITDVDPIELDLYFERFINLYRINPPDFDIDFSWKDRDDVTRYIFERFNHVALVATYNRFQARAVRRELGKVFGLPKEEIDKLKNPYIKSWELNQLTDLVLKYSDYIHGFPSHLSIHASGIVISEKPLNYFTPTFMPPKGYPTIQFDMHIAEDVGLYKFDILSQRGLGKIKDALDLIRLTRPDEEIDIHDMRRFKTDERIKHILRNAKAIGCFYVESPAMRMLLRKLQVDNYLGLVAASSVIRPGVSQSGMMQEYIQRYRNPEKRKDAHPVLLKLMPETFGVMVYQEDVIKVAHHFAGLTLGEADKMRRGMSGKYRSREEFDQVKQKFFHNCIHEKGHSQELTAEVWRQTESFAGYAFAKGHSASYAVESYQSLFLKAYYPLEYMVATINNFGGFYSTELYVHEAKMHGGIIHAPCVNNGFFETMLYGKNIFIGFNQLHSFEAKTAKAILQERQDKGPFKDFNDFIDRVKISLEQLSILIRIDALRFTKKDKRSLLWEAHFKLGNTTLKEHSYNTNYAMNDLFRIQHKEYDIPQLDNSWREDTFDQIELLGFPLHSPFKVLREDTTPHVLAKDLPEFKNQTVWIKGYLIHRKGTATKGGQGMFFGTFLDEEGEWLDSVHFPQVAAKYPFRGKGVYKVKGKVMEDFDCIIIEAEYMEKIGVIEDPRYSEVRDEEKEKTVVTRNRRIDYFNK